MKQVKCYFSKFMVAIYKLNQKQWFVFSIITTTIGLWFPLIINFYGVYLKFMVVEVNPTTGLTEKHFTPLGSVLTLATILWSFLSTLAQRYKSNVSDFSDSEGKVMILEPMREAFSQICSVKLGVLLNELYRVKFEEVENTEIVFEKPCVQISEINTQLANVLSRVLSLKNHNLRPADFYIGIFYNFPLENSKKWFVADKKGTAQGLTIDQLYNDNSTFKKLLNEKEKEYVFYNSKQVAFNEQSYIPDHADERDKKTKELKGSIFCYKCQFVAKGEVLINCMICVSTYNKKFLLNPTQNIIDNMEDFFKNILFKEVSKRVGIELSLYYFNYINNKSK